MSLFGEQFLSRRNKNNDDLNNAIQDVIDAANGIERFHFSRNADENVRSAVEEIFYFLNIKPVRDIPEYKDVDELLDYMTRPSGIMRRHVLLKGEWSHKGTCPMLAVLKDSGVFVALIPKKLGGFYYYDRETGKKVNVNDKNKDNFETDAIVFYNPLPIKSISTKELISMMLKTISMEEILFLSMILLAITGIGLLTPVITKMIFSLVIPTRKTELVFSFAALLIVTAYVGYKFTIMKLSMMSRLRARMQIFLINATVGRMLHFPTSYFEGKSTGTLSAILMNLVKLPSVISNNVITPLINTVFAMAFIIQIELIAPAMMMPTLITFFVQIIIIVVCTMQATSLTTKEMYYDSKIEGLSVAVYDGIQRIKLSASQSRVLTRWSLLYSHKASAAYPAVFPTSFQNEFLAFTTILGTMAAYYAGFKGNVDVSSFAAFLTAFAFVTGNVAEFGNSAKELPMLAPTLKMSEEFFQIVPEISTEKKIVGTLKGKVEVRDLSFRYTSDSPMVFNGIDITINPGEYVAIVGKSGSGKSTLLRLLMGFEEPLGGNILYDEMDMDRIDPRSLRRNIGVVMQDGNLFNESIYTNIAISASDLTVEDAWDIAEKVGLADDIRKMPLGMNTLIPQGGEGISGGQRQRLMIARALALKPSILMLDEATSALDNITQKTVSDALSNLSCTRIVVAQRLSTIKKCDRILVLDEGNIVEDGSYEELMNKGGYFAELVERQQL